MNTMPMPVAPSVAFNLMWTEKPGFSEDVDLSAVMFNVHGQLLGRCSFDCKNFMNAIFHSGDQTDGKAAIDEAITINYATMPPQVHYIMIAVSVNNEKKSVADMFSELRIFCSPFVHEHNLLTQPALAKTFIPCVCVRSSPMHFALYDPPINSSPHCGLQNIMPVCEGVLDQMVHPTMRIRINPLALNVMEKVVLPSVTNSQKPAVVGLGWDVSHLKGKHGKEVDLDAHCYCLNGSNVVTEHIYFGNKSAYGGAVFYPGDNRTGKGEGDDEQIFVDFSKLDSQVTKLMFFVQIFTAGVTFASVKGEFVRLVCDGRELARFDLDKIPAPAQGKVAERPVTCPASKGKAIDKSDAALFCIIERQPIGRTYQWHFKAVLEPVDKNKMKEVCIRGTYGSP